VRGELTLESIRWQYLTGVPDQSVVSPETWYHDSSLVSRPGNDRVQLAFNRDYVSNVSFYPKQHEYLRTSEVPVLAIWGESNSISGPAGARAFVRDSSVVRRSTCFPADRGDAVLEIVNCLRLIDWVFLL
jgi:hypothetical protein